MASKSDINIDIIAKDLASKALKDAQRQLKALTGEIDGTNKTAQKSGSAFGDMFKSVLSANIAFAALSAGLNIVKGVFSALVNAIKRVTTSVRDFALESLNYAKDIEVAWKGVQKVYDGTAEEIETVLVPAAKSLTLQFGRQKAEVIETMDAFASMGKVGQENIDMTTRALEFATTGGIELSMAIQTVTSVSSIYKAESEELTRVLAVLNTVENLGAATTADLGEAIFTAGAIARDTGVDINEFASLINVLKENGIEAGEAANGLKTIFVKLRNPSEDLAGLYSRLGVNVKELGGGLKDADEILVEVAKSWDKLTEAEKELFNVEAGGLFQIAKLSSVMSDLSSEQSRYQEVLAGTLDDASNIERYYAELGIAMDSTAFKQAQLNSSWAEAKEIVGTPLNAALGMLLERINPLAQEALPQLELAVGKVKQLVRDWWIENKEVILDKVGAFSETLQGLWEKITQLIDPTNDQSEEVKSLASQFTTDFISAIDSVVKTIGEWIQWLIDNPDALKNMGQDVGAICSWVSGAVSDISSFVADIERLISIAKTSGDVLRIFAAISTGGLSEVTYWYSKKAAEVNAKAKGGEFGGVISAFSSGGVVPGTVSTGDNVIVRANSGEMILNQKQQSNLLSMLSGKGRQGGVVMNFNSPIYGVDNLKQAIADAFDELSARQNRYAQYNLA